MTQQDSPVPGCQGSVPTGSAEPSSPPDTTQSHRGAPAAAAASPTHRAPGSVGTPDLLGLLRKAAPGRKSVQTTKLSGSPAFSQPCPQSRALFPPLTREQTVFRSPASDLRFNPLPARPAHAVLQRPVSGALVCYGCLRAAARATGTQLTGDTSASPGQRNDSGRQGACWGRRCLAEEPGAC